MYRKLTLTAFFALLLSMVVMAHAIERVARPETNRQGVRVAGEEGHSH